MRQVFAVAVAFLATRAQDAHAQRSKERPPVAGTGIGLAIPSRILRAHARQLTIESELGVGTTVHIDIPVSRDRTFVAAESSSI